MCFELSSELKTQGRLRLAPILSWLNLSAGKYYRTLNPPEKKSNTTGLIPLKRISLEVEKKVVEVAIEHFRLGYRKIHPILRTRHGLRINKETVYRILKDHALLKCGKQLANSVPYLAD